MTVATSGSPFDVYDRSKLPVSILTDLCLASPTTETEKMPKPRTYLWYRLMKMQLGLRLNVEKLETKFEWAGRTSWSLIESEFAWIMTELQNDLCSNSVKSQEAAQRWGNLCSGWLARWDVFRAAVKRTIEDGIILTKKHINDRRKVLQFFEIGSESDKFVEQFKRFPKAFIEHWTNLDEVFEANEHTPIQSLPFAAKLTSKLTVCIRSTGSRRNCFSEILDLARDTLIHDLKPLIVLYELKELLKFDSFFLIDQYSHTQYVKSGKLNKTACYEADQKTRDHLLSFRSSFDFEQAVKSTSDIVENDVKERVVFDSSKCDVLQFRYNVTY